MGFQLPTSTGDPPDFWTINVINLLDTIFVHHWGLKIPIDVGGSFFFVKAPPKDGCPVGFVGINGDQINGSYFTDPYFHGIIIN